MASIDKLAIRGVRSFSPEDAEQTLQFFSPITVIVGANGCGKTTIIESIKYGITGGMPHGAKASFVHDPRSVLQTSVQAYVKLKFRNTAGDAMLVKRKMELTRTNNNKSLRFQQLDGVLRKIDPHTGKPKSTSIKHSELNEQVPQLLGVSKAVLDHVLFCHQEVSCWPLQEGAVLKKRFDAIFFSTRYYMAIEVLRKKEKTYIALAKDIKADVASLRSHMHAAQVFQKELDHLNEQLDEIDDTKSDLKKKIAKAERVIAKSDSIIAQVDAVDHKIKVLEDERNQLQSFVQTHGSLVGDHTDINSLDDLDSMLGDFDRDMSSQVGELKLLKEQQSRILSEIESLRQEEMKLADDMTMFEIENEAQQERLRRRYSLMESIAQTHSLAFELSQTQADQSFAASMTASMISQTGGIGSQDTVIPITAEDMQSFFKALDEKEKALSSRLDALKKQTNTADDDMLAVLLELSGTMTVVKTDLERQGKMKKELLAEQAELSRKVSSHSRLPKGDVEDSRKKATELAKQRDKATNDPRMIEIKTKIRQLEEEVNKIKRQIGDDHIGRDALRHSPEAQNSVAILEEQRAKDKEALEELIRDKAATLQKFNLPMITQVPVDDDSSDELMKLFEGLVDSVRSKYDVSRTELSSATADVTKTQQVVSEKTALVRSIQHTLTSLEPKIKQLEGSVDKIRKLAQDLRRHEELCIRQTCRVNEENPRELLKYLKVRLEAIEDETTADDMLQTIQKVFKKLKKMARAPVETAEGSHHQCPCCKRDFDDSSNNNSLVGDLKRFDENMDFLAGDDSPLVRTDAQSRGMKANYEGWMETVSECMDDLRDYLRMSKEMSDLKKEQQILLDDVPHYKTSVEKQESHVQDLQQTVDELRDLVDTSNRCCEDASRIAEKCALIAQKKGDLSASISDTGRDFGTVEKDLNNLMGQKDELADKITSLNREMTEPNIAAYQLSTQATRTDQTARDGEERFSTERKNAERKAEVAEQLQKIEQEEKELQDQRAHLNKEIQAKKTEKDQARALGQEKESALLEDIARFNADVQDFRTLAREIDECKESNKSEDHDSVATQVTAVKKEIADKQQASQELQPQIDEMTGAVNVQDRRKQELDSYKNVVESEQRIAELNEEIKTLKEDQDQMNGADSAKEDLAQAEQQKNELQKQKHQTEGRFSAVVEQIRSLKRKLAAPEYRDVDEQYRVAKIKEDTTELAAKDLKKFYTAIEKALLQHHRMKLKEINVIIRELWLLTYKGDDITNIELVTDEEAGSRAAKSYNYRVVMTKGVHRMDMRNHCSAGQRVLASIVIRLALAETYGVSCGVIALDEPTVNLDLKNKKGLAVALAQIVASRAEQSNFQLVLITHDEEFVSFMKTELSSLTGFSMPEKYFRVHRKQANDNMYYSKIEAINWDQRENELV